MKNKKGETTMKLTLLYMVILLLGLGCGPAAEKIIITEEGKQLEVSTTEAKGPVPEPPVEVFTNTHEVSLQLNLDPTVVKSFGSTLYVFDISDTVPRLVTFTNKTGITVYDRAAQAPSQLEVENINLLGRPLGAYAFVLTGTSPHVLSPDKPGQIVETKDWVEAKHPDALDSIAADPTLPYLEALFKQLVKRPATVPVEWQSSYDFKNTALIGTFTIERDTKVVVVDDARHVVLKEALVRE